MARTLTANITTEKDLAANRPVELYEIEINDLTTLFFTDHNEDITFDSQLYTAFPISRSIIQYSADQKVSSVQVNASNVDLAFSAFIAANDIRNKSISIKKVFLDKLADANDFVILFKGVMDSPSLTEEIISLICVDEIQAITSQLPKFMYTHTCGNIFKSTKCGYVGVGTLDQLNDPSTGLPFTKCGKSLTDCKARGNTINFFGFPFSPKDER